LHINVFFKLQTSNFELQDFSTLVELMREMHDYKQLTVQMLYRRMAGDAMLSAFIYKISQDRGKAAVSNMIHNACEILDVQLCKWDCENKNTDECMKIYLKHHDCVCGGKFRALYEEWLHLNSFTPRLPSIIVKGWKKGRKKGTNYAILGRWTNMSKSTMGFE
jgi:hypothetical protein